MKKDLTKWINFHKRKRIREFLKAAKKVKVKKPKQKIKISQSVKEKLLKDEREKFYNQLFWWLSILNLLGLITALIIMYFIF